MSLTATAPPASIELFVPGVPIGQGSKTFVPTAAGPRAKESNEAKLKPWRASIVQKVEGLVDAPLAGAVSIEVDFCFPRPKSHYRTGRFATELRADAPFWHVSMPDADKLERALGDALAGVVIANDSQIARWLVRKHYGTAPGAWIVVTSLDASEEVGF